MMQNMRAKSGANAPKDMKGLLMWAVIVLAVVIVVLIVVMATPSLTNKTTESIDEDAYYAVFLSNGQVYFGHLADINTYSPVITDIYYLQMKEQAAAEEQVQPAEGDQPELQAQTEQQPELTLVKLGKELHGPEDVMVLNRDHVLFYEKLKSDSNVVKAIEDDKAKEE